MTSEKDYSNNKLTPRENFLMSLLNKVVREYKALLEHTRYSKPLKIVEILYLSTIPGETKFAIQVKNKNCVIHLAAAEIISNGYNLNDFNNYHAEMIRQAALGKLIEFLNLSEKQFTNKIISKKFDRDTQQFIFTIQSNENNQFTRTAEELSKDKELLASMSFYDIYDLGYTHGSESLIKERTALMLAKNNTLKK